MVGPAPRGSLDACSRAQSSMMRMQAQQRQQQRHASGALLLGLLLGTCLASAASAIHHHHGSTTGAHQRAGGTAGKMGHRHHHKGERHPLKEHETAPGRERTRGQANWLLARQSARVGASVSACVRIDHRRPHLLSSPRCSSLPRHALAQAAACFGSISCLLRVAVKAVHSHHHESETAAREEEAAPSAAGRQLAWTLKRRSMQEQSPPPSPPDETSEEQSFIVGAGPTDPGASRGEATRRSPSKPGLPSWRQLSGRKFHQKFGP